MKWRNKLPNFKALGEIKQKAQAVAYANSVKVATAKYNMGMKNFKVLAIGIEAEYVAPKILKNCRSFLKEETKEPRVVWRKKNIERIETIMDAADRNVFLASDAVWVRETFVPYMEFMLKEYKQVWFWLVIGKHREIKKNVKKRKKEEAGGS